MRMHTLELLPGLGKKKAYIGSFWKKDKYKPFESFQDIKDVLYCEPKNGYHQAYFERVNGPRKKYRIFTK